MGNHMEESMRFEERCLGRLADVITPLLTNRSPFALVLYCLDIDLKSISSPDIDEELRIMALCYTLYGVLLDREIILFFQRFGGG